MEKINAVEAVSDIVRRLLAGEKIGLLEAFLMVYMAEQILPDVLEDAVKKALEKHETGN